MNDKPLELTQQSEWFAIRTRQDFRAEEVLRELCDDVFFPKEVVLRPDNSKRVKAVIPHVLFIRTSRDNALALEDAGRRNPERSIRFWIYRYPTDNKIQVIPERFISAGVKFFVYQCFIILENHGCSLFAHPEISMFFVYLQHKDSYNSLTNSNH